jgi:hypothetical protein
MIQNAVAHYEGWGLLDEIEDEYSPGDRGKTYRINWIFVADPFGARGGATSSPNESFSRFSKQYPITEGRKYQDDSRPLNWNQMALWLKSKLREKVGREDLVDVILKFFDDKSTVELNPAKTRFFLRKINRWLDEIKGHLNQPLHRFFDVAYSAVGQILRGYHVELERGSSDPKKRSETAGLEPLSGERLNRSESNSQDDPENHTPPAEESQRVREFKSSTSSLNRTVTSEDGTAKNPGRSIDEQEALLEARFDD